MRAVSYTVFALASAVAACSGTDARECRVGADCASGMCNADGTCVRSGATGGDASAPPPAVVPSGGDGGGDAGGDASLSGCTPNHDGTITRNEVPIAPGLRATFRTAQNEDVSTAGTTGADGKRIWDLSGALASDQNVLVETLALAGTWYGSGFPTATYATKLSASSDLLGVFQTSTTALLLDGVASPDNGATKTQLTYSPSVTVLGFPFTNGASWTSDSDVSGTAQGFPSAYHEKYETNVDAVGTLKTPLGTFDVLRVRTLLTRTVGLAVSTTRSFAFVSECYGTVATVTSDSGESTVEFTHAAEVRRIAP
ncbi:MAG TPA: hypothetical protein VIF62_02900 [Labilithrix sp.]